MNDDDTLTPGGALIIWLWIVVVGAICALIAYLFY